MEMKIKKLEWTDGYRSVDTYHGPYTEYRAEIREFTIEIRIFDDSEFIYIHWSAGEWDDRNYDVNGEWIDRRQKELAFDFGQACFESWLRKNYGVEG